MKNTLAVASWFALLLGLSISATVSARDDRLRFPVADALTSPSNAQAGGRPNPDIKLFWGNQDYPTPTQMYGTYTANKKTNFFNKSDKEGCEWVWLSAVLSLQERAQREGGNAVVNIKSVYRDLEFISETEYECGAGAFVGGVALRGTVVKLPQ